MRVARIAPLALILIATASAAPNRAVSPVLQPNDNTASAGTVRDGVLALDLNAQTGQWPANAGVAPSSQVEAFAERGKPASLPGPLIRVPAGTMIRASIHNTLARSITFFLPTSPTTDDSVVVAPGGTGILLVRATTPGNFIYRATTVLKIDQGIRVGGAMAGAVIVDSADAPRTAPDRVMVMLTTPDSSIVAEVESGKLRGTAKGWYTYTINGRSWPNTERIALAVGDTAHWRVINATFDTHPMHLHGFYFRVDDYTGLAAARDVKGELGRMVVTERMSAFSAMSMTWAPERAGNWLLHCHFALHLAPDAEMIEATKGVGRVAMPDHGENHALTGMVGLVLGITVSPRPGSKVATAPVPGRRLRLIAVSDPGFPDTRPSMRFVIEENGRQTTSAPGFSPTLYLRRNEAVAITVVNRLSERTAVHWHGMELESYFDGVAGLSGTANQLAPTIAPGDSFVARFTPPRSGTYMYHSHVDDIRQQPAGLVGAMIITDGPPTPAPEDHEIFLKGARDGRIGSNPLEIGGLGPTDTLVLHAGRAARFRLMSLTAVTPSGAVSLTTRPDSVFTLVADSMIARWTPVAKDGMDLPAAVRAPRTARQVMSMGETFDFTYTPMRRGEPLRVEVRNGVGALLARVPVRVE